MPKDCDCDLCRSHKANGLPVFPIDETLHHAADAWRAVQKALDRLDKATARFESAIEDLKRVAVRKSDQPAGAGN